MSTTYKPVAIIMDNFTNRSLEFDFTTLYDAGSLDVVTYYDYYTVDGYTVDGYGDYDSVLTTLKGPLTYIESSTATVFSIDELPFDNNTFTGIYGYNAYSYGYLSLVAHESSGNDAVQHGDWVLDLFKGQLDTDIETILIDIDSTNGSLNATQNALAYASIDTVVRDWLTNNNTADITYVPVVLSISSTSGFPSNSQDYAIQTLFDNFTVVVQSLPNVTSSGLTLGNFYNAVIDVAAYNVDTNSDSLHGNVHDASTIDVFANGYTEHAGWDVGWEFGTSFATPRVAAEVANILTEALNYVNLSLASGELTQESLESSGVLKYDDYVASILESITTDIYLQIDNEWATTPISVLSDDVIASPTPVLVPTDAGSSSVYHITSAAY